MPELASASIRVDCTFIPLKGYNVLLPNACIDEVFLSKKIEPIKRAPQWCLGLTSYKNNKILIVQLESIESGNHIQLNTEKHIIIKLKRPAEFQEYAEIGILADKIPHVIQANNYSLEQEYSPTRNHTLAISHVKIKDKKAFIPDIKRLYREYTSQC